MLLNISAIQMAEGKLENASGRETSVEGLPVSKALSKILRGEKLEDHPLLKKLDSGQVVGENQGEDDADGAEAEGYKSLGFEAEPTALVSILNQACAKHAQEVAFVGATLSSITYGEIKEKSMTFAEWEMYADGLAAYFQKVKKLRRGDRVALLMPNILQYPITLLAALRAGLTPVLISPFTPPPKVLTLLKRSKCRGAVIWNIMANPFSQIAVEAALDMIVVSVMGELSEDTKKFQFGQGKMGAQYHIQGSCRFKEALQEGFYHEYEGVVDAKGEEVGVVLWGSVFSQEPEMVVVTNQELVEGWRRCVG